MELVHRAGAWSRCIQAVHPAGCARIAARHSFEPVNGNNPSPATTSHWQQPVTGINL
jgi:hypothetical protein